MSVPLSQTTFVVIDLETSGGSPAHGAGITEIGAVKVCGGELIAEFHTLINPGHSLPSFITEMTGIDDAMLVDAPPISRILPTLMQFIGTDKHSVLVAHNAPFDIGFLKAAAADHGHPWPNYRVIDSLRIARHVLTLEDVPNCTLGVLAEFFGARTSPTHRALDDARATVDVFHAIVGRLGSMNISTIDQLEKLNRQRSPRLK